MSLDRLIAVSTQSPKKKTERHPEWDTFYQVLYVGPPRYEGSESEKCELTNAIRAFSAREDHNSEIVKIAPSFMFGSFIVWTKTEAAAANLPGSIEGYERVYAPVAID